MQMKPQFVIVQLIVAVIIAAIHFAVGFETSLYAAGQEDSLGNPHGYGWIIAADVFVFPLLLIWDFFHQYLHLSERFIFPLMIFQSVCWGVVLSLFFRKLESRVMKPIWSNLSPEPSAFDASISAARSTPGAGNGSGHGR
jgi:hypothetical protein